MHKPVTIACFGEILWDVFPDQALLGGAPLNVAMRLHSLGADVHMISCLGNDDLGKRALKEIKGRTLPTGGISIHESLPTGVVQVSLTDGIASYEILQPVAWDEIPISKETISRVRESDALVYGSLALRSAHNLNVLLELGKHARHLVFDINLREPFYNDELIEKLIHRCDTLKLNDEELVYVGRLFSINDEGISEQLKRLSELTNTMTICVTLGDKGAVLFHKGSFFRHPGYQVKVQDTVGAGDSFLAGLISGLFTGQSPDSSLDLACALGGIVASKAGANCTVHGRRDSSDSRVGFFAHGRTDYFVTC